MNSPSRLKSVVLPGESLGLKWSAKARTGARDRLSERRDDGRGQPWPGSDRAPGGSPGSKPAPDGRGSDRFRRYQKSPRSPPRGVAADFMKPAPDSRLLELQKQLPAGELRFDSRSLQAHAGDKWFATHLPDAVALPRTTQSVSKILDLPTSIEFPSPPAAPAMVMWGVAFRRTAGSHCRWRA